MKALHLLLLPCLLAALDAAAVLPPVVGTPTTASLVDAVVAAEHAHLHSDSSLRAQAVMDRYRALGGHLATLDLAVVEENDLRRLLDATRLALLYRPSVAVERDVAAVTAALAAMGRATLADYTLLYDAAIASRQFDRAVRVRADHPQLLRPPAPTVRGAPLQGQGVGVYRLGNGPDELVREALDTQAGRWLVIVSSPRCSFSNRAAQDIEASPRLQQRLAALDVRVAWLQPVDGTLGLAHARHWAASHPGMSLYWADTQADWPQIDNWDTPTFYLLRDGILIGSTSGWRGLPSMQALESVLDGLTR